MKVYIVYKPSRRSDVIALITNDIEEAKKEAKEIKQFYLKKGWQGWANRVKIISPNTREALEKIKDDFYTNYYLYSALSRSSPWWKEEIYGEWLELLNESAASY